MAQDRTLGMVLIGVADIVFAAVGSILSLLGIGAVLIGSKRALLLEGSTGMPHVTVPQPSVFSYLLALSLAGLIVAIAAFAAGLALLLMWRWARTLNLTYAVLAMVRGLVVFCFPVIGMDAATNSAGISARLTGLCLSLIYPVILLLLFARPGWRAPFGKPQLS